MNVASIPETCINCPEAGMKCVPVFIQPCAKPVHSFSRALIPHLTNDRRECITDLRFTVSLQDLKVVEAPLKKNRVRTRFFNSANV